MVPVAHVRLPISVVSGVPRTCYAGRHPFSANWKCRKLGKCGRPRAGWAASFVAIARRPRRWSGCTLVRCAA